MNIYTTSFFATCPNNNARINYTLKIESQTIIQVEDLIDTVNLLNRGFHEEIADQLFREFGGKQTLVADHHSVTIESIRP